MKKWLIIMLIGFFILNLAPISSEAVQLSGTVAKIAGPLAQEPDGPKPPEAPKPPKN